jgi:hypothetical protein
MARLRRRWAQLKWASPRSACNGGVHAAIEWLGKNTLKKLECSLINPAAARDFVFLMERGPPSSAFQFCQAC